MLIYPRTLENRVERHQVMALAQARKIDAILVTEMTRWGRSTIDLIQTLQELHAWNVSLIAQTGIQFDLTTPQGRLIAGLMATLAEFERDLVRERVRSGIAAAYEIMHMLKKGQIEQVEKGAIRERVQFIAEIFGVAA